MATLDDDVTGGPRNFPANAAHDQSLRPDATMRSMFEDAMAKYDSEAWEPQPVELRMLDYADWRMLDYADWWSLRCPTQKRPDQRRTVADAKTGQPFEIIESGESRREYRHRLFGSRGMPVVRMLRQRRRSSRRTTSRRVRVATRGAPGRSSDDDPAGTVARSGGHRAPCRASQLRPWLPSPRARCGVSGRKFEWQRALKQPGHGLTVMDLAVLHQFALWADVDGRACPSVRTVAKSVGVVERTVQKSFARAEQLGWMTAPPPDDRPGGKSTVWRQLAIPTSVRRDTTTPVPSDTSRGVPREQEGVSGGTPKEVKEATRRPPRRAQGHERRARVRTQHSPPQSMALVSDPRDARPSTRSGRRSRVASRDASMNGGARRSVIRLRVLGCSYEWSMTATIRPRPADAPVARRRPPARTAASRRGKATRPTARSQGWPHELPLLAQRRRARRARRAHRQTDHRRARRP